jgi:sulfate permease, SulP family
MGQKAPPPKSLGDKELIFYILIMNNPYSNDDISISPLQKDLKSYSWGALRHDIIAGLSVAFLTVPQAMACSLLAGVPLYCGLFAAIFASIVVALFGSSSHMIVGPSNAIAILIQAGTAEILYTFYRDVTGLERDFLAIQILTQLTMTVGALQLLAAGCKLGRLTQFVSHSVVVGYLAGVAISLVVNQLFTVFGLPRSYDIHSVYEKSIYLIMHLHKTHIPTALVGISSCIIMLIFKRMSKRLPAAVFTLIIASTSVYLFDSMDLEIPSFSEGQLQKVMVVGDTGDVFASFPKISLPFFNLTIMNNILSVAFAIALLSIMETTSVAKSLSASTGQRLSVNQEIFSLGLGNLFSSLMNSMPLAGSPSRSAISYQNGAKTRFAAVFNCLFVGVIVFALSSFVTRIPLASLAAILLISAASIVNKKHLLMCLKATSSDAFVLWITFLSCIFFSLDVAFYIGVVMSITLYLKKAAIPQLIEYTIDETGSLKNKEAEPSPERQQIRVIKVKGELFFGAADLFQTTLKSIAEDDNNTKVIILQLKNARDIDATSCLALKQLHDYLRGSGRHLILCGLTMPIWEVLSDSGMVEVLGKENLFLFDERHPHLYLQKALANAKKLVKSDTAEAPVEALPPEPEVELAPETLTMRQQET